MNGEDNERRRMNIYLEREFRRNCNKFVSSGCRRKAQDHSLSSCVSFIMRKIYEKPKRGERSGVWIIWGNFRKFELLTDVKVEYCLAKEH